MIFPLLLVISKAAVLSEIFIVPVLKPIVDPAPVVLKSMAVPDVSVNFIFSPEADLMRIAPEIS